MIYSFQCSCESTPVSEEPVSAISSDEYILHGLHDPQTTEASLTLHSSRTVTSNNTLATGMYVNRTACSTQFSHIA